MSGKRNILFTMCGQLRWDYPSCAGHKTLHTPNIDCMCVRADLDEDLVYQVTKTFWENFGQITSDAPWTAALDVAFSTSNPVRTTIHPGAARYYREVGILE
ncbi:MAG: TAXI family TRAP transporter solute-binding subunit [Pseudomonadota bacterium]